MPTKKEILEPYVRERMKNAREPYEVAYAVVLQAFQDFEKAVCAAQGVTKEKYFWDTEAGS